MTARPGAAPAKRALFLCPSPFEIGTYFRAHAIARDLVARGICEVDLICTSNDGVSRESRIEGVRVVQTAKIGPSLAPMRGWNPGEIFRRFAVIARAPGKYDLVYSFEYQPTVAAIAFPAAFFAGALHFNDWCDWYAGRHHRMGGSRILQRIDAWMEEFPRRHVDLVTAINGPLHARALASGVTPERLLLVREGADGPRIRVEKNEARARLRRAGRDLADDAFLAIAMLDQGTHIHEAAIARLIRDRPEARLAILGKWHAEVPSPAVFAPGRVSDEELDLWLQAADCAWLPLADTELNRGRLPHKIGHFRRYGLPLVTTAVGDVPDLGDSGIILVENDGAAFAKATAALAPLTEASRTELAESARALYAWDEILGPLREQIAQAIKR